MGALNNKIAVVTGAARGIGHGIVDALTLKGAKVYMTDVLAEEGDAAAKEFRQQGRDVTFVKHDVCSQSDWQALFSEIEQQHSGIDILVNNAGIAPPVNIETVTIDELRQALDVNLIGAMIGLQLSIASMKKKAGGSIINIASNSTALVTQATGVYSPSKAAVTNLSKVAALHCAREQLNIRINTVHPGACRTPMIIDQFPAEAIKLIEDSSPMGRLGEPIEIGQVVAFLASDEASFVTGAEYFADGGATLAQF